MNGGHYDTALVPGAARLALWAPLLRISACEVPRKRVFGVHFDPPLEMARQVMRPAGRHAGAHALYEARHGLLMSIQVVWNLEI